MNRSVGNLRITEMEKWDQEYIGLVQPGYFQFSKDGSGEFVFGTVNGSLDWRYDDQKDPKKVEFSWEGISEYDPVCVRGWFEIAEKNQIQGMLFFSRRR